MMINLILSIGFSAICTGLCLFVLMPAWQEWGDANDGGTKLSK